MSNPAFTFDHIHIISQTPHDAANWYVQMFGAEIVADKVAYGAPQIFLELGGKTLVIRGHREGETPVPARPIQPLRAFPATTPGGPITLASCITATCAPSTTSCVRKACSFPWN